MEITVRNGFSCKSNPFKIIVEKNEIEKFSKPCKKNNTIILNEGDVLTIKVDPDSPGTNVRQRFWIRHSGSLDTLLQVIGNVIEESYGIGSDSVHEIRPGRPDDWYIKIVLPEEIKIITDDPKNVTIGDANQLLS
jgi:hypothetical protein